MRNEDAAAVWDGVELTNEQFKRLDVALIIGFPRQECIYRVLPGFNDTLTLVCKVPMSKNDWTRVVMQGVKSKWDLTESEENAAIASSEIGADTAGSYQKP